MQGWLRRVSGGFVRASEVALIAPSTFAGVHYPSPATAFFLDETILKAEPPIGGGPSGVADGGVQRRVHRHDAERS